MSTISSFRNIQNELDVYRSKACMKNLCKSLRQDVIKMINFKKKKMQLLTKEQQ